MKISRGEAKIIELLKNARVHFIHEKSFQDLHKGVYRFDFYLPYLKKGPAIIEFNGEQHYQFNTFFFKTRQDFLHQQNNDRRKISYCLANNIKLYCIPYWEIDNINTAADLFQDKYLAKTRWKNDDDWRQYKNVGYV